MKISILIGLCLCCAVLIAGNNIIGDKGGCAISYRDLNIYITVIDTEKRIIKIKWDNKVYTSDNGCEGNRTFYTMSRKVGNSEYNMFAQPSEKDTMLLDTIKLMEDTISYKMWRRNSHDTHSYINYSDTIRFLSEAVGLIKNEKTDVELDIVVYPNPTNGQISIKSKEIIQEVKVFDLQGKKQHISLNLKNEKMQWSKDRDTKLNIDHLPVGVYSIQFTLKNNKILNKRLIKN